MLDVEYRDKSSDEQRAEALLRSELFVDWSKLGEIGEKMPVRFKKAQSKLGEIGEKMPVRFKKAQSWTAAVLSE